jgi:protein tyrosine phosphatase (PTP) superfamily phosphohydrolase (DUF442 family)
VSNPTDAPPDIPDQAQLPPEETSGAGAVAPPPPATEPVKHYKQPFLRWFGYGVVRIIYRWWTRIAAHLFPEGSRQARIVERLGIPLPDRLDLSWITPDLAVGGRVRVGDIPKLQRVGVTRVVDVRQEHRDDEAALNTHHIELLYLPTPDTYPLSLADLRRGAQWINAQRQAHQRVLVHCEHGVGRSVLLAAAALVCEGYTPHDAFDLIGEKRWQASPNHRQVARLSEFARAGACKGE